MVYGSSGPMGRPLGPIHILAFLFCLLLSVEPASAASSSKICRELIRTSIDPEDIELLHAKKEAVEIGSEHEQEVSEGIFLHHRIRQVGVGPTTEFRTLSGFLRFAIEDELPEVFRLKAGKSAHIRTKLYWKDGSVAKALVDIFDEKGQQLTSILFHEDMQSDELVQITGVIYPEGEEKIEKIFEYPKRLKQLVQFKEEDLSDAELAVNGDFKGLRTRLPHWVFRPVIQDQVSPNPGSVEVIVDIEQELRSVLQFDGTYEDAVTYGASSRYRLLDRRGSAEGRPLELIPYEPALPQEFHSAESVPMTAQPQEPYKHWTLYFEQITAPEPIEEVVVPQSIWKDNYEIGVASVPEPHIVLTSYNRETEMQGDHAHLGSRSTTYAHVEKIESEQVLVHRFHIYQQELNVAEDLTEHSEIERVYAYYEIETDRNFKSTLKLYMKKPGEDPVLMMDYGEFSTNEFSYEGAIGQSKPGPDSNDFILVRLADSRNLHLQKGISEFIRTQLLPNFSSWMGF